MPSVERCYSAYDIAMAFHKAGIFMADVVSIEKSEGLYNRVYIGVQLWHDTEAAYNFMMRLCNNQVETRFVYDCEDELWWAIHINKFIHKLDTVGRKKRIITTFEPSTFEDQIIEDQILEENHAWVDILLEKMESDQRYRYEQPSLEYQEFKQFY